MNSIMLSPHSQHKTLKSLTLKFHSCSKYLDDTPPDWFTFDIWMEAAKQRNLEKLNIYYLLGIPLVPTIFSCKTLVVLRLTGINVATMFRCSVDLPVLKALYLSDVCFKHMEDFMKLLSGCPKLLDLKTRDVMATTGITTGGCFKPLSKLLHADIGLFEVPLRAVSNVEFLTLTKQWMWESLLDEETNSYYKGYPVFENLTILRLIWYDCDIILEWEYVVVTMLQNCPKLQDLCMSKWWDLTNSKDKDDWEYPDHVPECVSSHLTTCSLLDYHAVEADFRFVTYILQNAKLLQVMEIHYSKNRNSMERPQFIEDLSSYPRISPVCELSIIPR
ncbi:hypothetical protein TSUD_170620 [Trifolium subterraneum]|uniref:FBD domain-containing protein n=1 Tax=Trifolium subterraneum TaxID=3900 RepID=A0A2Z6LSF6_TRISU|nr:hypothetical protein TSUD_170620 [Trifolium subterraneum]